jgi:hypothetical protein
VNGAVNIRVSNFRTGPRVYEADQQTEDITRGLIGYLRRHHWGMLATFIALGGTAYALDPSNSHIHACVDRATSTVRIVDHCRRGERAITWAKTGPAGPSDGYQSNGGPGSTSVKVPPGDYIATADCTATQARTASQSSTIPAFGEAVLFLTTDTEFFYPGSGPGDGTSTAASVPNMGQRLLQGPPPLPSESGSASLSTSAGFHLPHGGTIFADCYGAAVGHGMGGSEQPLTGAGVHVTAIRVGTLHMQ